MHIVIDGRWIYPEISGIGNYTRQLIRELVRLDHDDRYTVLFRDTAVARRTIRETALEQADKVTAIQVGYGIFSPWNQLRLPGLLQKLQADIYHTTNYMMPVLLPPPPAPRPALITTLHDVIPLLFPDHAPRSRKSKVLPIFRLLLRRIAMRADSVLTVSQASGRDIRAALKLPPEAADRIRVVYNGVAPRYQPTERAPHTAESERTILYVGRADPYKQLTTLVRAFHILRREIPFPVRLTVAGAPDPRYPEAARLADQLGLTPAITWTGYLSDNLLTERYQQADVLAHPSLYEGFGLQIIEAQASGTPVVCTTGGAQPEVAGDAALLAPPGDPDTLAAHLRTVLTDPGVADDLRRKGFANVQRFSWRKTAEGIHAVYRETAARAASGVRPA